MTKNSIICFEHTEKHLQALWRCLQKGLKWDYFHVIGMINKNLEKSTFTACNKDLCTV